MATLKLKTFPETNYIPLGCYAERVSSLVFLRDGETQTYPLKLLYVRDEGEETVVRDRAGRNWPEDATEIEIEFVPREVTPPSVGGFDFNPRVADELDDD